MRKESGSRLREEEEGSGCLKPSEDTLEGMVRIGEGRQRRGEEKKERRKDGWEEGRERMRKEEEGRGQGERREKTGTPQQPYISLSFEP